MLHHQLLLRMVNWATTPLLLPLTLNMFVMEANNDVRCGAKSLDTTMECPAVLAAYWLSLSLSLPSFLLLLMPYCPSLLLELLRSSLGLMISIHRFCCCRRDRHIICSLARHCCWRCSPHHHYCHRLISDFLSHFVINRESFDRRSLLGLSPAVLLKSTTITQTCTQL